MFFFPIRFYSNIGVESSVYALTLLTFRMTSAAAVPGYGVEPNVTISHISMPKLQISDLTENILSYRDSIAIHLKVEENEREKRREKKNN